MYFLIFLIFFSKLSFHFIKFVPYSLPNIIFQYGIHPYINIILSVTVGSWLILKRLLKLKTPEQAQSKIYLSYIAFFCVYLITITLLQALLQVSDNILILIFSSFLSVFMINLFGRYIPTQISAIEFVEIIKKISVILCWLSLGALILTPGTSFMGGRFIGIFKHIPHMVSVATLACVFSLYFIFYKNQGKLESLKNYLSFLCGFFLLILTGTRSALASVILSFILSFVLFKPKLIATRLLRFLLAILVMFGTVFFGYDIADYTYEVVRGERSVGLRAAQDGVSSRLDEVLRGFEIFEEHPFLGQGLISKFGPSDEAVVGAYDANKDPHNIFVSAGVIGGWGFVFIVLLGFMMLIVICLKGLKSEDKAKQLVAIYMTSQLPILFIYHMHLSIGGIADRIYWLCVGLLVLDQSRKS